MDLPNINLSKYRSNINELVRKCTIINQYGGGTQFYLYVDLEKLTGNLGQYFKSIGYLYDTHRNYISSELSVIPIKKEIEHNYSFWINDSFNTLIETIKQSFNCKINGEYTGCSVSRKLKIITDTAIPSDQIRFEISGAIELFISVLLDDIEQISFKNKSILEKSFIIRDDFDIEIFKAKISYYEDSIEKVISYERGHFSNEHLSTFIDSLSLKLTESNLAYEKCKTHHSFDRLSWHHNMCNELNRTLNKFLINKAEHSCFNINDENAVLCLDGYEENYFLGRGNISLERFLELSKRVKERNLSNQLSGSFNKFVSELKEI